MEIIGIQFPPVKEVARFEYEGETWVVAEDTENYDSGPAKSYTTLEVMKLSNAFALTRGFEQKVVKKAKLIIWHDKHGDYPFEGDDAALKILAERIEQGYIEEEAEDDAQALVDGADEDGALDFLRKRRDYEYEGITETVAS